MKNLTQTFSDLSGIKQDNWECYPRFLALKSKQSLDPQEIYSIDQSIYLLYVTMGKIRKKIHKLVHG